jgi:hypothetical protein
LQTNSTYFNSPTDRPALSTRYYEKKAPIQAHEKTNSSARALASGPSSDASWLRTKTGFLEIHRAQQIYLRIPRRVREPWQQTSLNQVGRLLACDYALI